MYSRATIIRAELSRVPHSASEDGSVQCIAACVLAYHVSIGPIESG